MNESKELQKKFLRTMERMRKLNMSRKTSSISKNEFTILGILGAGQPEEGALAEDACFGEISPKKQSEYGLRVSELAALMRISPPSVSRTLKSMTEKGYIFQRTDRSDRRNSYVYLTEAGKQRMESHKEHMDHFTMKVFERMGFDSVEQLLLLLNQMIDIMEDELNDTTKGD
mgnify:FL=1